MDPKINTQLNSETKQSFFKKPWVRSAAGILAAVLVLLGLVVYKSLSARVSIDTSVIQAPVIQVNPQSEGILQAVYVKAGDQVKRGQALAQVGGETLSAATDGLVIAVDDVPGQVFVPGLPGPTIVSMIDPAQLRVVATVDEDKGFAKVAVGDPVSFTVDAFGGQTFTGVVDSISPTSDDTSAAFTISDKRPTRQFEIKIRYDAAAHPDFKNGMSAKVKIYPKK